MIFMRPETLKVFNIVFGGDLPNSTVYLILKYGTKTNSFR